MPFTNLPLVGVFDTTTGVLVRINTSDGTGFTVGKRTQGIDGKPVLTNRNNISAGANNMGVSHTSGLEVQFPYGASEVQFVYSNTMTNSAGGEADATADLTVACALEYPLGSTPIMLTFNGQSTATVPFSGAKIVFDPLQHDIPAGGFARLWTFAKCATGTAIPGNIVTVAAQGDYAGRKITGASNTTPIELTFSANHTYTTGAPIKVAQVGGNTNANTTTTATVTGTNKVTLDGTVGNGTYTSGGYAVGDDSTLAGTANSVVSGGLSVFAPMAVIGQPAFGHRAAAVGIIGDSIANGTGEGISNAGFIVRALGGPYLCGVPFVQVSRGGTKGSDFTDATGLTTKSIRRRNLVMSLPYIIYEYGTNDWPNGVSLAQMQANMLALATQVYNRGNRFSVTTLTPSVTTSDAGVTVSGQTLRAAESTRTTYNSWLRDGAPVDATTKVAVAAGTTANALRIGMSGHPVWKTFDPASTVEVNQQGVLTLNGGYWPAGMSADGVHPNTAGHTAMATAIPASVFVPF